MYGFGILPDLVTVWRNDVSDYSLRCHFMFSAYITFASLTNTHKGIEFNRLVCSCAILILSGKLADPKVDVIVKLLTNQTLVSLIIYEIVFLPSFSDVISMNLSTNIILQK